MKNWILGGCKMYKDITIKGFRGSYDELLTAFATYFKKYFGTP